MFHNNDVICFLGDSITANGLWMAEVYQELRKKYTVKCYNCGVSGSTASKASNYLFSNCLIYNPDYVVIMFGVNDSARWLLSESNAHLENKEEQLTLCFQRHKESYESIIKECTSHGSKVIICIPVPYDEISDTETENLRCQYLLDRIGDFQREMAKKYGCTVVDFSIPIKKMLGKSGIMRPDRVHPTPLGHHILAQIFLRDIGEISEVNLEKSFEFEEWNLSRYNAELKLHKTNYVEFCDLFENGWLIGLSSEEKKKLVLEKYNASETKEGFIPEAYLEYIEKIDDRQRLLGDVVRLTI